MNLLCRKQQFPNQSIFTLPERNSLQIIVCVCVFYTKHRILTVILDYRWWDISDEKVSDALNTDT